MAINQNRVAVADQTTAASYTTSLSGGHNDLLFTAKTTGPEGNEISVTYVDPEDDDISLDVSVSGTAITVTLATDETSSITTTASDIKSAIEANAEADDLVSVEPHSGNDGSGIVTAMEEQFLDGGVTAPAIIASRDPDGGFLYLKNVGSSDVYLGNVSVTADDGYLFAKDEVLQITLSAGESLYAVTSSGTAEVYVLKTRS